MAAIAEVGAKDSKKPENEKGKVTIYFGVFFDGTNNHRLQVAKGKLFRGKNDKEWENFYSDVIDEKDWANGVNEKTVDENGRGIDCFQYPLKNTEYEKFDEYTAETILNQNKALDTLESRINREKVHLAIQNTTIKKKAFGLKFWQEQDLYRNDYTNIALLEPFYTGFSENSEKCIKFSIYICGSGTSNDVTKGEDVIGLGVGQGETGVIQKVIDVCSRINRKLILFPQEIIKEINFDIFGFSRGATSARILSSILKKKSNEELNQFILKRSGDFLQKCVDKIQIRFLGIYDTVSSVGFLRKESSILNEIGGSVENYISKKEGNNIPYFNKIEKIWSRYHDENVKDLGLNNLEATKVVHICANDEYRENFALVPVSNKVRNVTEIFVPGCHADVGGGYNPNLEYTISLVGRQAFILSSQRKVLVNRVKGQEIYDYFQEQWLNNSTDKLVQSQHTKNIGDNFYIIDTIVKFTYRRSPGYNYITLRIMSDYSNEVSEAIFNGSNINIKYNRKYITDKDYCKIKKGETIDSAVEKKLRQQYLHFSSNYETIVNLPYMRECKQCKEKDEVDNEYERIKYNENGKMNK